MRGLTPLASWTPEDFLTFLSTDWLVRYSRGMGRDIQETKKRLLNAATNEFARRGIAGARVDRIADLAGCSKALIYDYFGNKDQLFFLT
ncbi:helix-turn-helix transcriptional regulator [Ktedonobacteria bacterium brp13]|nr:helix-turn-helix transcriptional regulator [Ktedonobacteria bacterium brp13]